ncbi:hypothetical protein [Pareuzebyella sediminis]|uniref:hypothetical protein n=1 Tax=Pareuzebyella sediminis TaxID=2607998 RepID=UPI0011EDB902|nr:hypothetical protein [Pareuzebyella sediminis]
MRISANTSELDIFNGLLLPKVLEDAFNVLTSPRPSRLHNSHGRIFTSSEHDLLEKTLTVIKERKLSGHRFGQHLFYAVGICFGHPSLTMYRSVNPNLSLLGLKPGKLTIVML